MFLSRLLRVAPTVRSYVVRNMNEFSVEVAQEKDKKEIYDLYVTSLFPEMPLYSACGVTKPYAIDQWPEIHTLKSGLILKSVTKEGKILGFVINVSPKDVEFTGFDGSLRNLFEYVEKDSKGLLSQLEKTAMENRAIGVDKDWRKMGVAKKLAKESEILAKKHGYKSIFGLPTGAYMEAACASLGWKCLYRLNYKHYANIDKNFKLPPEPHTSLTLYEKVFENS